MGIKDDTYQDEKMFLNSSQMGNLERLSYLSTLQKSTFRGATKYLFKVGLCAWYSQNDIKKKQERKNFVHYGNQYHLKLCPVPTEIHSLDFGEQNGIWQWLAQYWGHVGWLIYIDVNYL